MVKTIAFISWHDLIAPVLGPPLGGLIGTYSHWSWILWLNIPLELIALIATLFLVPQTKEMLKRAFDLTEFIYTGVTCVMLIIDLELVGQSDIISGLLLLAGGILFALLSLRHGMNHSNPLLPMKVMRIPTFRSAVVGGSFFRASQTLRTGVGNLWNTVIRHIYVGQET